MREKRFSRGEWTGYRMVHEDTGEPMTAEEVGEYVKNSIISSFEQSGSMDYMFASCTKEDGDYDVCHVGNGPDSKYNLALIAAAPELLEALEKLLEDTVILDGPGNVNIDHAVAVIRKAYGETP